MLLLQNTFCTFTADCLAIQLEVTAGHYGPSPLTELESTEDSCQLEGTLDSENRCTPLDYHGGQA